MSEVELLALPERRLFIVLEVLHTSPSDPLQMLVLLVEHHVGTQEPRKLVEDDLVAAVQLSDLFFVHADGCAALVAESGAAVQHQHSGQLGMEYLPRLVVADQNAVYRLAALVLLGLLFLQFGDLVQQEFLRACKLHAPKAAAICAVQFDDAVALAEVAEV